jgi:DNA-binding winged helix-turn-helix (wHTH) protein
VLQTVVNVNKLTRSEETIRRVLDTYNGGINEFKKGYQLRSNLERGQKDDVLSDSHNVLNRQKNYFSQLSNLHGISDVMQREIHTASH